MDERRQHVRRQLEIEFSYAAEEEPWGKVGRMENISAGGLRASVREPVEPGSRFSVHLTFTDHRPIPTVAEVVWSDKFLYTTTDRKSSYKIGLRFVRINGMDRERLKEYVAERLN